MIAVMTYKSFFTWHSFDFRTADSKIAACLSRQLYLKLKKNKKIRLTLFLAVNSSLFKYTYCAQAHKGGWSLSQHIRQVSHITKHKNRHTRRCKLHKERHRPARKLKATFVFIA